VPNVHKSKAQAAGR